MLASGFPMFTNSLRVLGRPRRASWLAAALACLALVAVASAEDARVVILHTTDLHGAFDAWDYGADAPTARGLTRIGTLVKRARTENAGVVLLDAGDCLQGGGASGFMRGDHVAPNPMMAMMNAIGYDAMAVGNHEFDFGPDARETARRDAKFPWLAANITKADGSPAFDATITRTVNGVKVGVVGLCTPAVPLFLDPALLGGLKFADPIAPAQAAVDRLRNTEHCDVIVLLAHTGLERDPQTGAEHPGEMPGENWGYRLADQVKGVDAVILGHTHVVIPSARVNGTLVSQAGRGGEALGRIEVRLSRADAHSPWRVGDVSARVFAVTDTVAEDSTLTALARPYHEAARTALAQVYGNAARKLDAPAGRLSDNALWNLIHRAQKDHGQADVTLAALPDPAVSIAAGPVTGRDVLRLYPFENTLGVVALTGAQLKEVLEHSAAMLAGYDFSRDRPLFVPGVQGWNFDMAEGVTYTIDLSRAPGDRIVDLRFEGKPLDPTRALRVAVNSYREFGGGDFPAIRTAPRLWQSTRTVREMIEEYLSAHPDFDPGPPDWTVRPAYAAGPERGLVDLMVREKVLTSAEALGLDAVRPVNRRAFATWLTRVMGPKLSPAPPPARTASTDPLAFSIPLPAALDLCERSARAAGYALAVKSPDAAFRRSLLTGTGLTSPHDSSPLTETQVVALLANLRFPIVRVLETTDFHGAILQTGTDRASGKVVGGSAALAAWVAKLRAENPEGTVLLDGGDWYQGTMISNLQFGRPVVEQMNALGYAAVTIGNHEFDWNADTLQRRIGELQCGAFGANIVDRKTGRRPRWAHADTVVTRRGVRIGVLGLAYRFTPTVTLGKYVAHLRFDDDSTTAARLGPALDRRSDVMIGMGHIPSEVDTSRHAHGDLTRDAHVPGFDLWLGGHSHNQVLDRVDDVPVMIAGSHGQYVGVCDLVWDGREKKVIEKTTRLQPTFVADLPPDSAMVTRIARWNRNVAPIAEAPLCKNARRLGRDRGGESSLGSLVADAMRAEVKADVAMQNSGGLRADLAEGEVTRGAIYEVMPFDNTLVTMELTGEQLRTVLEEGLANGRIPQISGIKFSFDMSREKGHRLVTVTQAEGQPLDDARRYRVVVNNFMAGGGDNYDSLTRGRNLTDTGINVRDALERYVVNLAKQNGGALDYKADGRIRRSGPASADLPR